MAVNFGTTTNNPEEFINYSRPLFAGASERGCVAIAGLFRHSVAGMQKRVRVCTFFL